MAKLKKGSAEWISAQTPSKVQHFRGFIEMHVKCSGGILHRWGGPAYLYVDLHAGRGKLMFNGREFDGSPLIARDVLSRANIKYKTLHYEEDFHEASFLSEAIRSSQPGTLFDPFEEASDYPVHIEPFEIGFSRWLDEHGYQPKRLGLIFSDPQHGLIPVETFNKAARLLPRVDLLAYASANLQYKRPRREAETRGVVKPFLIDDIRAVNKKYVMIREQLPGDAQQWTFIVWTNWEDFPRWEQQGFYSLDSESGKRILEKLNFTIIEQQQRSNTPLFQFLRPGDAPYRGYRQYLRHPRFLEIRAQVFERARGRCERCADRAPAEPHHLRYPPWGTFDVPENMIAVCHDCHCKIHGKVN